MQMEHANDKMKFESIFIMFSLMAGVVSMYSHVLPLSFYNPVELLTPEDILVSIDTSDLVVQGILHDEISCRDLSFLNADGLLEYPYLREGPCNILETHFWITLPRVPQGNNILWMVVGSNTHEGTYENFGGKFFGLFDSTACPLHWDDFVDDDEGYFIRNAETTCEFQVKVPEHTHDVTFETTEFTSNYDGKVGTTDGTKRRHKHYFSSTSDPGKGQPEAYILRACESEFFSLFYGGVFPFTTDNLPSSGFWTEYSKLDYKLIHVKNSSAQSFLPWIGHEHLLSGTTGYPMDSSTIGVSNFDDGYSSCNPMHVHQFVDFPMTSSQLGDNPPSIDIAFSKYDTFTHTGSIQPSESEGMLVFATGVPQRGWERVNTFNGKFFRGTAVRDDVGVKTLGAETHNQHILHSTVESSVPVGANPFASDRTLGADEASDGDHTHRRDDYTQSIGTSIPNYHSFFVIKRKSSLSVVVDPPEPLYYCFGVGSKMLGVCSGNGQCIAHNSCECDSGFFGVKCNLTRCFGVLSNNSIMLCSGRGSCPISDGDCECDESSDYFGAACNITTCFSERSDNTTAVCSNRGDCWPRDTCTCHAEQKYFGENCEKFRCFGEEKDSKNVCSKHGVCLDHDLCLCDDLSEYGGPDCGNWTCYGLARNHENICNGHGDCVDYDTCQCDPNYNFDEQCYKFKCDGIFFDRQSACNGHGTCVDHAKCDCDPEYPGKFCEKWFCHSMEYNDKNACSGHGVCVDWDLCHCIHGYNNSNCSDHYCNGIRYDNHQHVCSGRGDCLMPDWCLCTKDGYEGSDCNTWKCGLKFEFEEDVCTTHGVCTKPGKCKCEKDWTGDLCEKSNVERVLIPSILGGSAGLFFLVFLLGASIFLCIVLSQRKRLKKFGKLKDVDLLLEEQALEDDDSVAHLRINKKLFEIDYSEVKILNILGRGGSASTVFLCEWKNQKVAYKAFQTSSFGRQSDFDEFEREVSILGSVSHPNLVRFWGAILKPPRVGIGDLKQYVLRLKAKQESIPLEKKIYFLSEIACGMAYLHEKNIIHRDVKDQNVLLDEREKPKIMDFGSSKAAAEAKTKRIGTSYYMAPEVQKRGTYDGKCDVYSYAILAYVIVQECISPFGENDNFDELKVVTQNLRPSMTNFQGTKQLKDLIVSCWHEDPSHRLSFSAIQNVLARMSNDTTITMIQADAVENSTKEKMVALSWKEMKKIVKNSELAGKYSKFYAVPKH